MHTPYCLEHSIPTINLPFGGSSFDVTLTPNVTTTKAIEVSPGHALVFIGAPVSGASFKLTFTYDDGTTVTIPYAAQFPFRIVTARKIVSVGILSAQAASITFWAEANAPETAPSFQPR